MLEADALEHAHLAESRLAVQADGRRVGAVADHGEHLAPGPAAAPVHERLQERGAHAAAAAPLVDVDGVLERESIRRARAIGAGVAVAGNRAVELGHDVGLARSDDRLVSHAHLLDARRDLLEARQPVQDMVGIDGLDRRDVGRGRVADGGRWGHGAIIARLVAALAGMVLLAFAAAARGEPNLRQVEALIAKRTNEFRSEEALRKVESDGALDRAAREFAEYMARTDRYGHRADGSAPADRARARGYDYCLVSENISYQFTTGEFAT